MKCSKCGEATRVEDSRMADNTESKYSWLVNRGRLVFGWWSQTDFRLRKRRCLTCGHKFISIEVELADLKDAFADVKERSTDIGGLTATKSSPSSPS